MTRIVPHHPAPAILTMFSRPGRETSRSVLAFLLAALGSAATVAPGCGDYVRYQEGEAPGGDPIGRAALDQATRERLAKATRLDHLLLQGILGEHVVPDAEAAGFVYFDYGALNASDEGLLLLDQYLATLDLVSQAQLEGTPERLAYWINGYNAAVIRGVLNAYRGDPRYSVSDGGFIFFDLPAYRFGGVTLSLNQLEHAIIRGDFRHQAFLAASSELKDTLRMLHTTLWDGAPVDARIHVAVNCAAISCPNLPGAHPFVYRAESLDAQLDRAARAFVDNPSKGAGSNGISQLFDWYAADFEARFGNAAGFIQMHRQGGLSGVDLDRLIPYDWSLNIAPTP